MTTVTVAGNSQSDIESAILAAGAYGTVIFPNDDYTVADLVSTQAAQTWQLERGATIHRVGGGALLTLGAPELRIRGGVWDGGRGTDTEKGIYGVGYGVDIQDIKLQNVGGWGVRIDNGLMTLRDSVITNTGYAAVLWSCPTSMQGPLIENNIIDNRYSGGSFNGIFIRSTGTPGQTWVKAPRILNNNITLAQVMSLSDIADGGRLESSVGIEVWNGLDPISYGNSITYGKIGISYANVRNGKMRDNGINSAFQYGLEVANINDQGSLWNILEGNTVVSVSGQPASAAAPSIGVSIVGASNYTRVVSNAIYWCSKTVVAQTGCVGTIDQFNY